VIGKPIGALLLAGVLVAGCATDKAASEPRCPADASAVGLSLPGGLGVSVGESGLKAAFNAIRDFFQQRPGAGEADKAKAADLAAAAAARDAAQPMNEEQKRALRSHAGQWVDTYAEKCR
jgi:hypothetical protein